MDQVTNAIVKIATFHSVAYAFNFYNPETVKKWNLTSWRENYVEDPEMIGMINNGFKKMIKDLENDEPDLINSVNDFKSKWIDLYKSKVCVDRRFISHGDFWIFNIMGNEQNDIKILDWQTLCPEHPGRFYAMAII